MEARRAWLGVARLACRAAHLHARATFRPSAGREASQEGVGMLKSSAQQNGLHHQQTQQKQQEVPPGTPGRYHACYTRSHRGLHMRLSSIV